MKKHRFELAIRTKSISLDGTAEVYGEGTSTDAQMYLRAALAEAAKSHGMLRLKPIKGVVIVAEAKR
jgi:hypothetical protein